MYRLLAGPAAYWKRRRRSTSGQRLPPDPLKEGGNLKRIGLWLIVLGVSAALFAACSDDDDEGSDSDTEAAATDDEDEADDGDAEANDDDADDEEVDLGSDTEGLPEDFNDLLANLDTFRAEYEFEGQDEEGNDLSGNLTILGLEGNLRVDFEGFQAGDEEFSGSVIATTDAAYLCAEGLQEGEEGTCFEFAGTDELDETGLPFGDLLGDLLPLADEAGVEVTDADDREIAGEDADCFNVTQEAVEEELEGESLVCLAENGIPLLVEGSAEGGEFRLEATSVSDDVSPSDFEPPFPTEEFDLDDLGDFDFDDFETTDDDQG
jgi:hypothetical protein